MYNMTQNRLPAPYELNQPQVPMASAPQSFAKGGRPGRHHKGMTAAHMSPKELHILDHLQGGPKFGHEGIREYSHLEELLKNPHIVQSVHRHAHHHRQRHAHGGLTPSMEHLRQGGRFGDSELALIGPHTHHLFNQLAGHVTRNPNTGHPEYFSLGGALSGLWDVIKPIAAPIMDVIKPIAAPIMNMISGGGGSGGAGGGGSAISDTLKAAAPGLLNMGQQFLGDKFGDMGRTAGGMLSQGIQSRLGSPSENANPYASALGGSLGRAAESYGRGTGASQAFGQGLNDFGSQVGGGFGNAMAESGRGLMQGQGWGESARRGARRGYDELGGQEGLRSAAGNIGQGLMNGGFGGAREAMGNQMNQYMQRALPRPANQEQYQEQYQEPNYEEMYG